MIWNCVCVEKVSTKNLSYGMWMRWVKWTNLFRLKITTWTFSLFRRMAFISFRFHCNFFFLFFQSWQKFNLNSMDFASIQRLVHNLDILIFFVQLFFSSSSVGHELYHEEYWRKKRKQRNCHLEVLKFYRNWTKKGNKLMFTYSKWYGSINNSSWNPNYYLIR